MILLIFRLVFLIVGAGGGYYLVNTFLTDYLNNSGLLLIGRIVGIIIFSIIGFFIGNFIGKKIIKDVSSVNEKVREIPGNNLIIGIIGLTTGIVLGLLVSFALRSIPFVGPFIPIFVVLIFSYAGIMLSLRNKQMIINVLKLGKGFKDEKDENLNEKNKADKNHAISKPKILDTSTIIDGRIADIIMTGFLEGDLIIPGFIVNELQGIADSSDNLKRIRGRTGLDILQKLQDNKKLHIAIVEKDYPKQDTVDSKLIALARELDGDIVTSDYNLNKVAKLKGIKVLNINDLSNSVKMIILPGEKMDVEIIKEGKEKDQGVAYLDDGTMIVIEGGRNLLGKIIEITITGILQTPAGRMIFSKISTNGE
ncbi:MAG: TRAM domain-containing protein [Actinobacteria bacterium]|nr:TRAM domain-containing protein [Actinomycetota bacterium]